MVRHSAGAATSALCLLLAGSPTQGAQADGSFATAIEQMKRSIAPLVCLSAGQSQPPRYAVQSIVGTVFFVSREGEFVTATHILAEAAKTNCLLGIYLPTKGWAPARERLEARTYRVSACPVSDTSLDVALCRSEVDLTLEAGHGVAVVPVTFDSMRHPDGTGVAFTGFPLQERIPVSPTGTIAAYWPTADDVAGEIMIAQSSWGGMSGGPVFLRNGRVVGMVTARGVASRQGMTMARPARLIEELLAAREPK